MGVRDVTPDFFAFWSRARGRSPDEQRQLWYELYEEPNRELLALCGGRHGNPEVLPAALARFPNDLQRVRETLPVLRAAIERTDPELARLFALDRLDLHWVLLVGMYWSDGWVVQLDGLPTCFIAVEMLDSPLRAEILLPHEAAHVTHQARLGSHYADLTTLGDSVFVEGLATLASSHMAPGFSEVAYLWAGLERTPLRGLPVSDWLAHCEASWPALQSRLLRELHDTSPERTAAYFLGSRTPEDLPERIGYFAGYRLVSALAKEHPIADLARWPSERITREIARELRHQTRDRV
jgi:hypothetical protein